MIRDPSGAIVIQLLLNNGIISAKDFPQWDVSLVPDTHIPSSKRSVVSTQRGTGGEFERSLARWSIVLDALSMKGTSASTPGKDGENTTRCYCTMGQAA